MRSSRAFLALAIAVSGIGLAAVPTAAAGAALDEPCADVEVIVARGSGQGLGESIEMSTFVDQLSTHLNGTVSMNVYELGTEAHEGHQLAPTSSCTMAAGAHSINGRDVPVTEDTVIDARTVTTGCAAVSLQGVHVQVGADLTVVADSLRTVGDVSFVSADGEPHRVRLITPAGAEGSAVTLARGLAVDPQLEVEVVTGGTVTIGGPSAFTGSVVAGLVRTTGQVAITAPRAL